MWFISWTFGVFIIGIIPILSYIMPNVFYSIPVSFDTVQYFGKFLPINKNKTIESVLAGSKLH